MIQNYITRWRAGDFATYRRFTHQNNVNAGIAPAAGDILFLLSNFDTNRIYVIERIAMTVSVTAAVTSQHINACRLFVLRQYLSPATAGSYNRGANISGGNDGKAYTNDSGSHIKELMFDGGTPISGFTATLDLDPSAQVTLDASLLNTVNAVQGPLEFLRVGWGESTPIFLFPNEAVEVQWGDLALSTGSLRFDFTVVWAEMEVD